jgi:hypothetical protein
LTTRHITAATDADVSAIIPLDPKEPRKGIYPEIMQEKKERKSMMFSLFGGTKEKKKSHENLRDLISAPTNFE